MDISYLLGASSHLPEGSLGSVPQVSAPPVLGINKDILRNYRDIRLPGMAGKVTPFKDLTHPSKLMNKRPRTCTVNVNGERVEVEVEPGRRRRRFETTPDVRDHLAALRRKEMLLRQDSNLQEVPGSPLLHPSNSSSSSGFRDEMSIELSLHDNPPPPPPAQTKARLSPSKETVIASKSAKSSNGSGHTHNFTSPVSQPSFQVSSEQLDPSLQLLLGSTVSPAVGSPLGPSPTHSSLDSNNSYNMYRYVCPLNNSSVDGQLNPVVGEELINDDDDDGGVVGSRESTVTANFGAPTLVGHEGADTLSEMPILGDYNNQSHSTYTSSSLPFALPYDSPPPSLSILNSQTFISLNQSTHDSRGSSSNLRPGAGVHESFNPATFGISRFHPREE